VALEQLLDEVAHETATIAMGQGDVGIEHDRFPLQCLDKVTSKDIG
jgi:hypothetical protein